LEKVLKDHGVSNYSIFLHPETRQLFGYAEVQSEVQWALIDLRGVAKGGGNTWAMLGCLCRLTGTCKMVNCIT
jgi:L-rhamnose mutarotase